MNSRISIKPPTIISIAMLLLALIPLPIGYYTLLRIVVCLTAAFLAWNSYEAHKTSWMWTMGVVALIFNPLIPLYLGRELWIFVDIATAVIFGVYLVKFKNRRET